MAVAANQVSEKKLYMDLGFTEYQARRLTEVREISPDKIKDILGKGCSVELAYRIFRPIK